jgi:hypothetical protein
MNNRVYIVHSNELDQNGKKVDFVLRVCNWVVSQNIDYSSNEINQNLTLIYVGSDKQRYSWSIFVSFEFNQFPQYDRFIIMVEIMKE